MSVSFCCKCIERKKPITKRAWGVTQRRCNHSAFNGYRWTASDYSTVICFSCHSAGRTKAAFVRDLPDVVFVDGDWAFKHPHPDRVPCVQPHCTYPLTKSMKQSNRKVHTQ